MYLWACVRGEAATQCIHDAAGLQAALTYAASNNQDDLIMLQSGHYSMSSTFLLAYAPSIFEQYDLTIEGGYQDLPGNPCGDVPAAPDARQTVLDGGLISLRQPSSGAITLKALTISNTLNDTQHPIPVSITGSATSSGDISIQNSILIGNVSTSSFAILFNANLGTLRIDSSVFASNASFGDYPIYFSSFQSFDPGNTCISIDDSTFTDNASVAKAVRLNAGPCATAAVNDIFWGNANGDVQIDFPAVTLLDHDDFGNLTEVAGTSATNLLSANPLFNTNFSLKVNSPLRDAGNDNQSAVPYDVIGNPRLYESHQDIGAYEIQDVLFIDGFDPH